MKKKVDPHILLTKSRQVLSYKYNVWLMAAGKRILLSIYYDRNGAINALNFANKVAGDLGISVRAGASWPRDEQA